MERRRDRRAQRRVYRCAPIRGELRYCSGFLDGNGGREDQRERRTGTGHFPRCFEGSDVRFPRVSCMGTTQPAPSESDGPSGPIEARRRDSARDKARGRRGSRAHPGRVSVRRLQHHERYQGPQSLRVARRMGATEAAATPKAYRNAHTEAFVLEHGRAFSVAPLTNEEIVSTSGNASNARPSNR